MKIYYNANLDEIQTEEEARQSAIEDVERFETHLEVLKLCSSSDIWDMLTKENRRKLYKEAVAEALEIMKIYYSSYLDEEQAEEEARLSAIEEVDDFGSYLDVLSSYSLYDIWDMLTAENRMELYQEAVTVELETDNYTCREIEI